MLGVRHARHLPFLSQPSRPFAKRRHARVTAQIFWLKNRDPAHWPDAWQMEQVLGRYIISDRPMTEEGQRGFVPI